MVFFLFPALALTDAPFEITYAPEVVYQGEPLAFRVFAPTRAPVRVSTNGVDHAELTFRDEPEAELTFLPGQDTTVEFSSRGLARVFQVAGPTTPLSLRERDGFLETDAGIPVILLPDHRKPPPLDRRWETLALLRRQLSEHRKPLGSLLWVSPPNSETSATLSPLLSKEPPRLLHPAAGTWFQIHGLLVTDPPPKHPYVVLEVDVHDLERGMPLPAWVMKWQFFLQRLEQNAGMTQGLLLGPPSSPETDPWMPRLRESLGSLARAHHLRFVDRSQPESVWKERLLHHLQREHLLP